MTPRASVDRDEGDHGTSAAHLPRAEERRHGRGGGPSTRPHSPRYRPGGAPSARDDPAQRGGERPRPPLPAGARRASDGRGVDAEEEIGVDPPSITAREQGTRPPSVPK